jgi:AraC-like DNA-binding protein
VYFEYHLIRENFSMTRVADRAGLERTHLYRKLKQLGVELGRGARRAATVSNDATARELPLPDTPLE